MSFSVHNACEIKKTNTKLAVLPNIVISFVNILLLYSVDILLVAGPHTELTSLF